jgi:hypothetical protein
MILNHIWIHVHTTIISRWIIARIIPRWWHNRSSKRILWKVTSLVMTTFTSWWCFYTLSTVSLITLILSSNFPLIFGQELIKTWPYFFLGLRAFWFFLEAPVRPTLGTGQTGLGTGQTGLDTGQTDWRSVDLLALVLPPQALKLLKPWGSPPEAASRRVFAFQWSHSFL